MSSRLIIIGGICAEDPALTLIRRISARRSVSICGRPPNGRYFRRLSLLKTPKAK